MQTVSRYSSLKALPRWANSVPTKDKNLDIKCEITESESVDSPSESLGSPTNEQVEDKSQSFQHIPRYTDVNNGNEDADSPLFAVNDQLNSKIVFWVGRVECLPVDALVVPSNTRLRPRSKMTKHILDHAGEHISQQCFEVFKRRAFEQEIGLDKFRLPTSSLNVTSAGKCGADVFLHAVTPTFNSKYQTAAETALHVTYVNIFTHLVENGLRSVAILPLAMDRNDEYSPGFQADKAAHLALRSTRFFLEKHGENIDHVIFCAPPRYHTSINFFHELASLYFPRSLNEAKSSMQKFSADKVLYDTATGERLKPARFIHINRSPADVVSKACPSPATEWLNSWNMLRSSHGGIEKTYGRSEMEYVYQDNDVSSRNSTLDKSFFSNFTIKICGSRCVEQPNGRNYTLYLISIQVNQDTPPPELFGNTKTSENDSKCRPSKKPKPPVKLTSWTVLYRYSEFRRFRRRVIKTLNSTHQIKLIPFPKKVFFGSSLSEEVIRTRKKLLQKWMVEISQIKTTEKMLKDFLHVSRFIKKES